MRFAIYYLLKLFIDDLVYIIIVQWNNNDWNSLKWFFALVSTEIYFKATCKRKYNHKEGKYVNIESHIQRKVYYKISYQAKFALQREGKPPYIEEENTWKTSYGHITS